MSDFKLNVLKVTPKLLQTDSLKKKMLQTKPYNFKFH